MKLAALATLAGSAAAFAPSNQGAATRAATLYNTRATTSTCQATSTSSTSYRTTTAATASTKGAPSVQRGPPSDSGSFSRDNDANHHDSLSPTTATWQVQRRRHLQRQ